MKPRTGLPSDLGPKGPPLLVGEPETVPLKKDWMSRAVLALAFVLLLIAVFGVWLNFRPIPYSTERWLVSSGLDRGRMLKSLMAQTDFVGFPRRDVEHYLGPAKLDERQLWYDLGPADPGSNPEPRATVGDSARLYGVFSYDRDGQITQVLYSRRRPVLGSQPFDSSGWFGDERGVRRTMFTRALGELRARSLDITTAQKLLGPPDGSRIRAHYNVGLAGAYIGPLKALVIEYSQDDVVERTAVVD